MLHRLLCRIGNHLHSNWVFAAAPCGHRVVFLFGIREPVAGKTEQSIGVVAPGVDGHLLYDAGCFDDFIARGDGKTHSRPHRSQLFH